MKVLGIDFGTSYSSIATIENGKPVPIKTSTATGIGDSYSMPSAVYVEESGNILVGQAAEVKRGFDPGRYKSEFKRELGQSTPFILGDRHFLPEELCTEIFRYFRETAVSYLNGPAERVVITHPANFGNHKKELLKQAALRAGFPEVELLDEPTAAAIYYASKQGLKEGEKLLVYDLGGGTFDVALIKKQGDGFIPLTTPLEIERCGGIDFDRMIFENIEMQFREQIQALLNNKEIPEIVKIRFLGELEDKSLKIKHLLSNSEIAEEMIVIPNGKYDNFYKLERKVFQGMIADLVEATCKQIEKIISNAGLKMSDIDRVLLVGGSTRIPYIEEALRKVTGKPVYRDADPELAICFGAAVKGLGKVEPQPQTQTKIQPKPTSNKPTYISSLSLGMVRVPGATNFPTGEDDSSSCLEINYSYEMGKTQVTYSQWKIVYDWALRHGYRFANLGSRGGYNAEPGNSKNANRYKVYESGHADHPVTKVSWGDCIVWCNALTEFCNIVEGLDFFYAYHYKNDIVRNATDKNVCDNVEVYLESKGFRLPTSMEWELAVRYIDGKRWAPGNSSGTSKNLTDTREMAWFEENSDYSTHPVGTKAPNVLGIYDMSGNVFEWCFDWHPEYHSTRVTRGGSWDHSGGYLRVGDVYFCSPSDVFHSHGFRIARTW